MQNQNQKKSKVIVLIFIAILFFLIYLFWANFYDNEKKIEIDNNNTEIIIEKKDIEEIQANLDKLDIDLDDILNELEL